MSAVTNDAVIKKAAKVYQAEFGINRIYAHVLAVKNVTGKLPLGPSHAIAHKAKPFIKWVGGKRQLLKQFKELGLYPPDGFDPVRHRYFEPFVGGGAVFFDLEPEKAYLSDSNAELVTTYKVIRDDVGSLIKSLKKHRYEEKYYYKVRAQDPVSLSDVEVASRFIFLNRAGFNGMYRVNKSGKFNIPFGRHSNPLICDVENLRKVSETLQHTEIKVADYKKVLRYAQKGDFIYLDPPYYPVSKTASFTAYTAEEFLEKEQIELRDTFLELHKRGCFVMLSNSDTPFINKIYTEIKDRKINIHKIKAGRMINSDASKRGKINEVLVTNY
ncbi:DNA adenine methylase [Patescibacteria group bacterium]|nr:MAG: DNA adenine methylase [Patescibacteria group bacterium]